ncbi:glycosyltransferase family 117 protein [Mangrovivirga cuniculi]|uniref:DUF2723 domain-containing protein n=1 Tax=Mangrovivirga cuniculi TaxID=2715131 RepID=A0A4D7KAN8_9BACT|nr:DUF2723 domain-containing protein [Mangrovivirga cuniculi]QCK16448.1 DUF2723 domain-containing protein [Mangrovivirga cuniculi]
MKDFRRINNITGWLLFIIATIVYTLTVEETASFWDCGEFIAVSYKLEVPHPPGAPLFLMLGRFFSMFTDDVTQVAFAINMLSVIASGFTILFLYWTIVLFGRKLLSAKIGQETKEQGLLLLASGIVGALAYTFSDTFWFSAVEAEVYALSSFFTAFVVWAMLKWELVDDQRMANRWLLLIAYMVGLSIGVHLLNLVTIPALALIMYFKYRDDKSSLKGGVIAILLGLVIVGVIQIGIIPGLPSIAGKFEVFFVNSLGFGFGSGIIFFCLLLFGGLIFGIWFTQKKGLVNPNTILLALTFILIGYSSYTMVVIRSNYNPPIDENDPQDVMSFVSYLKREQYGSRPLLFGPYYNTELQDQVSGEPVYVKGKDKYEIADYKVENEWAETHFFPRIWNSEARYQQQYRSMLGLQKGEDPNFSDNLYFMFTHQIGHMYLRYFMWNFAGRESDIQDAGWMTPWQSDDGLPYEIKENKARNQLFMLPLLLGLLGLVFNFSKNQKTGIIVTLLFLLLGVALVMYLNSPPSEPRERDYIYAGSFYAFCIWVGFGVMAIADILKNVLKNSTARVGTAFILSMIVPVIMASENWDDHDRSNRYFSVDAARNYLESCAPNAILFTGGDNDTFPLWYLQEVEGVRTDVRVIVLSYFNTDWYIEQMHRQAYESDPLPFTLSIDMIQQGGPVDYLPYVPSNEKINQNGVNLNEYLNLLNKGSRSIITAFDGKDYARLLSKKFFLSVDSAKAASIVPEKYRNGIVDNMWFNVKGNGLYKNDFMILDLIAGNNWERPIYFNSTSMRSVRFDIQDYLVQEGLTYRLVPSRMNNSDFVEATDTDEMYKNVMEKWRFRELDNPDSYYNEDYRGFVQNHRYALNALAEGLINDGEIEKAHEIINKSLNEMPDKAVPYDFSLLQTVEILFKLSSLGVSGAHDQAVEMTRLGSERMFDLSKYYIDQTYQLREAERQLMGLNVLANQAKNNGETELAQEISQKFNTLAGRIGGR